MWALGRFRSEKKEEGGDSAHPELTLETLLSPKRNVAGEGLRIHKGADASTGESSD